MAAELEQAFSASSELIQGSGGIFDVEYKDSLIFSKHALNRFPADGEIVEIVQLVDNGHPLWEAKEKASEHIPKPLSFAEWFHNIFKKRQT